MKRILVKNLLRDKTCYTCEHYSENFGNGFCTILTSHNFGGTCPGQKLIPKNKTCRGWVAIEKRRPTRYRTL